MSDGWLGFIGGTLAALVGALIASVVQRQTEMKRRREQAHVDAYFLLIELTNWYFWVTIAELHGEEPRPKVLEACRRVALQLNDKIRSFEGLEQLEEVLTILFSETIPSARDRAQRLDALLKRYGQVVTPRYSQIMERISRENLLRHGPGNIPTSNAPASWSYRGRDA